jgi:hypothetical protein
LPEETRWHEMAKEVIQEIGKQRGYSVSESETEMILATRLRRYKDENREIQTLKYKPDVVWKQGHIYRAIFEIEYLNPDWDSQLMNKRKYAIGSIMLAHAAMLSKSISRLVFVTNSKVLCDEIAIFLKTAKPQKYSTQKVYYIYNPTNIRQDLMTHFYKWMVSRWKL